MLLPPHKDSIFLLQGRIFFMKNQKQCQLQNTITQLFLCGYWRAGKSDKLQSLQGTENSPYSTNSSCFSSRWLQGRKICSLNGSNSCQLLCIHYSMQTLASQTATPSHRAIPYWPCVTIPSLAPALPTVQPHCQLGLITENKSRKKPKPQIAFCPSEA